MTLKSPFPYFGGKSKITPVVWQRLGGDLDNYIEPFFGSGAMLLARPGGASGIETVNDKDGYVSNFWRALQAAPDEVARFADWPVNENDLHARHIWLVNRRAELTGRLEGDPEFYDAKVAGWWVWGICCWIGSGWCSGNGPWNSVNGEMVNTGDGVKRQLPHLGGAGQGVNRKRPHLGSAGKGVNRQLPHLGGFAETGVNANDDLHAYFAELAARLRRVRVCSGDWERVCGPTPTFNLGITGVFLDPPYSAEAGRDNTLYATEDLIVSHRVREWCAANGDNPLMRIALCGYSGEGHEALEAQGWTAHRWKSSGGYCSQGEDTGRVNATREVIWFSPHCVGERQKALF